MQELKENIYIVRNVEQEQIAEGFKYSPPNIRRKNNRKNTAGRRTQYINCMYDKVFPPILYVKCIKHFG